MESILLFSDLHADIGALDAILRLSQGPGFRRRYGPAAKALNLGDALERGHDPEAVIRRLEGVRGLVSVLGNHDEAFLWNMPVSGSDQASEQAHAAYRATGEYGHFFDGMGRHYVDRPERLYAVHGGPIDPRAIAPAGADALDEWAYAQTWQRISETGARYVDDSGYHYLPQDAFAAAGPGLDAGFAIVCGHEHREAAYRRKNGAVVDALASARETAADVDGVDVREKRIRLEEDADHLVRLGIAGPEGYGYGRRHFGVYTRNGGRAICLLNIPGESKWMKA